MRAILRSHSLKQDHDLYKFFQAAIDEKGSLEGSTHGTVSVSGLAGISYNFRPFDPKFNTLALKLHKMLRKGKMLTIKSASGNTFKFEALE